MLIRRYEAGEEQALWDLFYNTIHNVNIRDYSEAQIAAWAPPDLNPDLWRNKIALINPFVAVINDQIVGYTDLQDSGLIDHFYCHYQWQRKGVGSLLMKRIYEEANRLGITRLFSNVSITAKPFYTAQGFSVVEKQLLDINGERLINFNMKKELVT